MSMLSPIRLLTVLAIALAFSCSMSGQSVPGAEAKLANLIGTVTDVNGDPVPNATVVLETPARDNPRTMITPENGYFELAGHSISDQHHCEGFCGLDIAHDHA
jgi:hypothetical protein